MKKFLDELAKHCLILGAGVSLHGFVFHVLGDSKVDGVLAVVYLITSVVVATVVRDMMRD